MCHTQVSLALAGRGYLASRDHKRPQARTGNRKAFAKPHKQQGLKELDRFESKRRGLQIL